MRSIKLLLKVLPGIACGHPFPLGFKVIISNSSDRDALFSFERHLASSDIYFLSYSINLFYLSS